MAVADFCIPAQLTIPPLVRWMLVLEDSDEGRLYFAKGLPREWVASGEQISITGAPTRWGRVNMKMRTERSAKNIRAEIQLARPRLPKEIQVKFGLPKTRQLERVAVNGRPTQIGGRDRDSVIAPTGNTAYFEIVAAFN
jgi:hypothetical protein